MVHRMNDGMQHEMLERRSTLLFTERKVDAAHHVVVREAREKRAHLLLDICPCPQNRVQRRVVLGLQAVTPHRTTTAVEPAPLGAHDMDQCAPNGAIAAGDGLHELLGPQLRHDVEQSPVGPVMVVVQALEIGDSHRRSWHWATILKRPRLAAGPWWIRTSRPRRRSPVAATTPAEREGMRPRSSFREASTRRLRKVPMSRPC